MKFVDYNFVSNEDAAKIMESYGYGKNTEETSTEEVVEESAEEPAALPDCVITRDAGVFGLCEDVEEIDGDFYIQVSPIEEELYGALEENESAVLETVDYEEESYELGDVFEDENTGDIFVQMVQN